MSGIYIHVPFCKQECHYCDFYKTTLLGQRPAYLQALMKEIDLQTPRFAMSKLETIYWGGGTPSLIDPVNLGKVLNRLEAAYGFEKDIEITLEVNPDDVNHDFLKAIRSEGFNRLSMGIQSFDRTILRQLNRRHNPEQALHAVELAHAVGFDNISIDFIYGIPGLSNEQWEADMNRACSLPVSHISAYHLTIEEGTPFGKWHREGRLKEIPEEQSILQYEILCNTLQKAGYEQYEISNFAKNGLISRHNTSYWQGKKYLGLGPSAHSYNGEKRCWNVSDLHRYTQALKQEEKWFECERLSTDDRYNEYLLTHLRTRWNCDLDWISGELGKSYEDYLLKQIQIQGLHEYFSLTQRKLALKRAYWFISDAILSRIFKV